MKESFLLDECGTHLSVQCSRNGRDLSPTKFWIRLSFDSILVGQDSAKMGIRKKSLTLSRLLNVPPKIVETSLQSVLL